MNGTDFVRTVHPVSYRLRLYITLMQCNAHKLRLCNATLINCAYAMQRSYIALMQCNAHILRLCNAEREPEGDDRIRNGNSSVAVKIGIRKIFGGNGFKLQRVTRNMNGVLGIRKSVTVHII